MEARGAPSPAQAEAHPQADGSPAAADAGRPTLAVADGVAEVRLSRPTQRNALRDADLRWLLDTFALLDADPAVRVVVLSAQTRGQPRPVFCAGYDTAGFEQPGHDPRLFERVPDTLQALRPVTIAALGGSVFGGATDLALACDLRVGVTGGEFRMPAAAIGLHYYPSGLRRFVDRLGPELARQLFLTAQPLTFERLHATGFFTALAEPAAFAEAVATLARQVAGLAPLALQATKQSLREIETGDFDLPRLRERETLALASRDFAEGRAALRERRPPRFEGR